VILVNVSRETFCRGGGGACPGPHIRPEYAPARTPPRRPRHPSKISPAAKRPHIRNGRPQAGHPDLCCLAGSHQSPQQWAGWQAPARTPPRFRALHQESTRPQNDLTGFIMAAMLHFAKCPLFNIQNCLYDSPAGEKACSNIPEITLHAASFRTRSGIQSFSIGIPTFPRSEPQDWAVRQETANNAWQLAANSTWRSDVSRETSGVSRTMRVMNVFF
jgi:hypothetical protein